jgi:hypothetical protein
VGTGTDDPARHSLAALQWQDGEEVRSITVPGRPVTINGFATTGPSGAGPDHGSVPSFGPSKDPDGTTVPISLRPTAGGAFGNVVPRPRSVPDEAAAGADTSPRHGADQPHGADGPTGTGPGHSRVEQGLTAEGLVRRRRPTARRPLAQSTRDADALAGASAAPASPPAGGAPRTTTTADGLPRRVRQASLAPQLRDTVPDESPRPHQLRSPDQVRTIMSALQRGTTRGRLAAAGIDPDAGSPGADGGAAGGGFDEAATVSLPIVRDHQNHVIRPDKDA